MSCSVGRAAAVAAVIVAIAAVGGCAARTAPPAPGGAVVTIVGKGKNGDYARVTWAPGSGSVVVRHPGGAQERSWFDRQGMYRAGVSGELYALRGFPTDQESKRAFLTGEFRSWHATPARSGPAERMTTYRANALESISVWTKRDGTITMARVGPTFYDDLVFTGRFATRWRAGDGTRFEATDPPADAHGLEVAPISGWRRAAVTGRVGASVDGRPARIIVDTSAEGLWISPSFANALHGNDDSAPVQLIAAASSDLMSRESPVRLVKLRHVKIAGKLVDSVYARVSDDDTFDLRAGIGLFPDASLSFTNDRVARLTTERCERGVPYSFWSGRVIAREPGRGIARTTLLSTAYDGPPLRKSYAAALALGGSKARCDARASAVRFGGRLFGSDVVCSKTALAFSSAADAVIGLHSLHAKHLVVDTRSARVCW